MAGDNNKFEAPDPLPDFVYKIIPGAPPSPLPAVYPPSELDRKDGFIHLSNAEQIPITAGLFFADAPSIWILKLRFGTNEPFKAATRWEGPRGCAHLYGEFGAGDVEAVREFARRGGEGWAEALRREGAGWLV